jgi:hypothetical protein
VTTAEATTTAPAKKRRGPFFLRLGLAHLLAYPLAVAWAVGATPLCVASIPDKMLMDLPLDLDPWKFAHDFMGGSSHDAATAGLRLVLVRILWAALVPFVIEHAIVLPWAIRGTARARRAFWIATGAIAAIGVFGGAADWIWLIAR